MYFLSLTIYGNDRKIPVNPQQRSFNSNLWTIKVNQSCEQTEHLATHGGEQMRNGQHQGDKIQVMWDWEV